MFDFWKSEEKRQKEQAEEEASKRADFAQMQKYASEFRQKYDEVVRECEKHKKNSEKLLSHDFNAAVFQKKLWDAINDVSIPLQKLDDTVNALKNQRSMN